MKIIDLRGVLPYESAFEAGRFAGKTSTTCHWPGIAIDPDMDDDAAAALIERLAQGHIDRDWSMVFGRQGGAGLMYHEVLAPSGTIFTTRDPDAIVWHAEAEQMLMSGNPNTTSHALLVLYSGPLTAAQRRSLAGILPARPRPTFGNSEWMQTACPGPELLELVQTYRATGRIAIEEEDVDAETKAAILQTARDTREIRDKVIALTDVSLPERLDRLGDRRDVQTGGPQT